MSQLQTTSRTTFIIQHALRINNQKIKVKDSLWDPCEEKSPSQLPESQKKVKDSPSDSSMCYIGNSQGHVAIVQG